MACIKNVAVNDDSLEPANKTAYILSKAYL